MRLDSFFPSFQSYAYTLLMPFDMHGLCYSMPPLSSLVHGIPFIILSIPSSSFSTPYFLWIVGTPSH
jgi:hypothetical protein